MLSILFTLALASSSRGAVVQEVTQGQSPREGRDYSSYSDAASSYPLAGSYYAPPAAGWAPDDPKTGFAHPVSFHPPYQGAECVSGGVLEELVRTGSYAKFGFAKTVLSTLIAVLLAKIPVLLVLKALLFKLVIVPFGLIGVVLPVLLPILYFFFPALMNMHSMNTHNMNGMHTNGAGTTAAPQAEEARSISADVDRVLRGVLGAQQCLERIACHLGERDAQSQYRKPVSWLLKSLQPLVPTGKTAKLSSYRAAYNRGAESRTVDTPDSGRSTASPPASACELYTCDSPRLMVRQAGRSFNLL